MNSFVCGDRWNVIVTDPKPNNIKLKEKKMT